MGEKISIVVSIYNQHAYLHECIDSVLKQTYDNFECILVNDGSTDDSLDICNEYAKKDSRFQVIDKENGGLTSTRIAGFDAATAEYICFLDGDDFLHKDFLKKNMEALSKENADMCTCSHFQYKEGTIITNTYDFDYAVYEGEDIKNNHILPIIGKLYSGNYKNLPGYVWGRIYKKSCIVKECFVSERKTYPEDDVFQAYLYPQLKKIVYIPDKLVFYRVNEASLTHTYRKNVWNKLKSRHEKIERVFQNDSSKEVTQRLLASAFYTIYVTLTNAYELSGYNLFRKDVKDMLTDEFALKTLKNLPGKMLSPRQKIMVFLLKYKQYFALYYFKRVMFK